MSLRSDRARRRASRQRNMRILLVVILVIVIAFVAYLIYTALLDTAGLNSEIARLYLRARVGSPSFSYITRPSLEMPSMIFSGVAFEKFSRIVL